MDYVELLVLLAICSGILLICVCCSAKINFTSSSGGTEQIGNHLDSMPSRPIQRSEQSGLSISSIATITSISSNSTGISMFILSVPFFPHWYMQQKKCFTWNNRVFFFYLENIVTKVEYFQSTLNWTKWIRNDKHCSWVQSEKWCVSLHCLSFAECK